MYMPTTPEHGTPSEPVESLPRLTDFYRALGDETRLRILHLLASQGELCVCDVESILEVTQSKASRHLNTLRQARLLSCRRQGAWMYYRLAGHALLSQGVVAELVGTLASDPRVQRDLSRARGRGGCESVPPRSGAAGAGDD